MWNETSETFKPQDKTLSGSPEKTQTLFQGIRILLAEDSADNEALMRAYLKRTGVQLEVARNGLQAVEMALEGDFDLILMDIQMPLMDGVQATRVLREKEYQKPIVALSAHALSEEINRSLEAGCQAYLTKPVTRAGLIEEIRKLLHIRI
jgi:CheY-like chemotaxis protein